VLFPLIRPSQNQILPLISLPFRFPQSGSTSLRRIRSSSAYTNERMNGLGGDALMLNLSKYEGLWSVSWFMRSLVLQVRHGQRLSRPACGAPA
jgi:hypothetical protein